jgi:Flavoprotein
MENIFSGRTIVLGISGGIAAYKAAELVRMLVKAGAAVHCIMTDAAREFIGPLTLQTLTKNPVAISLFDLWDEREIGPHGPNFLLLHPPPPTASAKSPEVLPTTCFQPLSWQPGPRC